MSVGSLLPVLRCMGGQKTQRPPLVHSKKSRILTRGRPRILIMYKLL